MTKVSSAGRVRIYTKDSYRLAYGRDGADDGLVAESWTAPTGQSLQVFKATGFNVNLICAFQKPIHSN